MATRSQSRTGPRPAARRRPADLAGSQRSKSATPPVSRRVLGLTVFLIAALLGMGARLVDLQLSQGPQLAAAAVAQQEQPVTIPAARGLILDDDGQVLAGNSIAYDIFADPKEIPGQSRLREATLLAPLLRLSTTALDALLAKPLDFVYLARDQSSTVEASLRHLDLAGIGSIPLQVRTYGPGASPGTTLAANLLGFVNSDGVGQYGLEGYYNSILAGHPGKESVVHDLQGNAVVLNDQPQTPAVDGRDLNTDIDPSIQTAVEQDLAAEVKADMAASGTMIVMNVRTGAIVAWADSPSYNANDYTSENDSLFQDAGIANLYEPGSVMKVVTFAGALENNVITPTATFDETPAAASVDGVQIHDWDNIYHGEISYQYVLDNSLNVGALHVEELEGAKTFYQTMENFGIGKPTGIDLAGEESQPLPPPSQETALQLATSSFGQGVVVTPIEMLAAVNAIANGGVWVQPHVVTSISGGGKPTTMVKPVTRRVVSAQTAATLAQMMAGVIDDPGADASEARIWPAWKGELAGKTGTAEVAENGNYTDNTIDSFSEFLPESDPEYSMICILREPQVAPSLRYSFYDAVPTVKKLTQVLIDRFKLQP
ncbi:MAG TPA: penicillin-binding protein 2 [Candidatus Dormibacteraeota bacterium]|nr:penicillin-binding protein 2 [Candidatus Dormibacteraeota bacterium]